MAETDNTLRLDTINDHSVYYEPTNTVVESLCRSLSNKSRSVVESSSFRYVTVHSILYTDISVDSCTMCAILQYEDDLYNDRYK